MSSPTPPDDLDEREVDLARWRRAIVAFWWIPVAALIVGAIVGLLYSFSGSSTYKASALISLGQPFSPGGSLVANFGTSPRAVSLIVDSASAQEAAEHAAGLPSGALQGHVSIAQVGATTGAGSVRSAPLISLTVRGVSPKKVAAAANALAARVVTLTTAPYVGTKIKTYQLFLGTTNSQLASISKRLEVLNQVVDTQQLAPLDKLVLISQVDNAEQRQGNLYDQKAATEQQLTFAQQIESAKVITPALAEKASAHSRNSSMAIAALIGLLLGVVAAIVYDGRRPRRVVSD